MSSNVLAFLATGLAALMAGVLLGRRLGEAVGGERRAPEAMEQETERLRDEVWELKAAAAARDRAEAASEAKSRFLATVSHEIRTPLNGILGMTDLLASMQLDAEAQSYLAAIRTSGEALGTLIDEILDFSRIEAGRLELDHSPFDLAPLVEGVVELVAPRAQGKGIEVAAHVGPDVPARLVGDAARLRQILINLAGNAVKYTERGGVGLRVSRGQGEAIVFSVEDTGPGVPKEQSAAIFQEFERGDGSATAAHGGAGLGLAISRALAERMGGELTLARSDATGSTFQLSVPLPAEAAPQGAAPSLEGRRALIVAQSPFEAPFLGEQLAAVGATVERAEGEDAAMLALAQRAPPDVVIVDCALGEQASRRIAEAARAAHAGRTLVLVSPFERRTIGRSVLGAFDGWLVKPVRHASLFARISDRLNGVGEAAPAAADAPEARPLAGLRVLVAEDNDINALIAQRCLERAGAMAERVVDGLAAVAEIEDAANGKRTPFDAVVMDIRMPRLDGLSAARRIRAVQATVGVAPTPLIALTANAAQEDRHAAEAAGFAAFFVKPFDADALTRAVATLARAAPAQGEALGA
ncbi:MAG: response regulator [Methylobacteriaceae bacterium]|nr:response regulator [Methylobacteriaceae bacterium]